MTRKPNTKIQVENKIIAQDAPAFIVAEGACNHLCNMDIALKMIDAAREAGADAIKFQTYKAEKLTSKTALGYGNINTASQFEYYKKFDKFGRAEYDELVEYGKERGIVVFSTPFDPDSAQMLNSVHMQLFKVASCDLLYTDLLRELACFEKPIILSTGGSTPQEIEMALETLDKAGARDVILLACTMAYPTRVDDANYRKIAAMKTAFPDYLVGISDHVEPEDHMISGAVCVSLGAKVLEKHFTLDRNMGGGSAFSMNPHDLAVFIRNVRLAERLLGKDELRIHAAEEVTRQSARRSLVANFDLKSGTVLSREMIGVKRPGNGIAPHHIDAVVGKVLKHDIPAEKQFDWSHFVS